MHTLRFDPANYTVRSLTLEGQTVDYRAWEGVVYVANPVSPLQVLNLYAPEAYFGGGEINGYALKTAPIFMPNTVGGYMPGPAATVNEDPHNRAVFAALQHGYVVACPGARGNGLQDENGHYIGRAPAGLCDLKAAVRWLRHNADAIPGDPEKIITNGTSAGGAMSSLLGATGNHPDYAPHLAAIGAAEERDDIFAASCYCPIINLDHADMAYEWEFVGVNDYKRFAFGPNGPMFVEGTLDEAQQVMSRELAEAFPAYVATTGTDIAALEAQICELVIASAQRALEGGADLSEVSCLTIEDGTVTGVDFRSFVRYRGRMKIAPAFDELTLRSPENMLFCSETVPARHFTAFGQAHSAADGALAEVQQVKLMNPMYYVGEGDTARHYRVRHGAADKDTSLAISALLVNALRAAGVDVDYFLPWGVPHSGDYDLPELFAWIDGICR